MRTPRCYLERPLDGGCEIALDPEPRNHCIRVLRLQAGDPLILFNGDGYDYPATLITAQRQQATVRLGTRCENRNEPMLAVHLGLGVTKGDSMELALQKAVELGVSEISPLHCQRSVSRIHSDRTAKRMERWRGILIAACEQCGRSRLPTLHPPRPLSDWLASIGPESARRLLLEPRSAQGLSAIEPAASVVLLIGPEGGVSEGERSLSALHGFQEIHLGPRILRAETAPIAALAALHALWGDLQ